MATELSRVNSKLTTVTSDITPLLLRRAVKVAVQATLVIAVVQPSNRFRNLLSKNKDFKALFKRTGHLDDWSAWTKCRQIDDMIWSRNQIEHPADMVQFYAEVVQMVSVLQRYKSHQAEHKTALWILSRFHAMSQPGGTS
jgi:hypothetical protein